MTQQRASARAVREDALLVQAMAVGDQAAFERLYAQFAPSLAALATRIIGAQNADDLVHDVFVEAWRDADRYDPERGSVRVWLTVRLRSRALDRLRKQKRRGHAVTLDVEGESLGYEPEEDGAPPDRRRVQSAVRKLPTDQRNVLLLSYFQGLSSSEIAEELEIPQGTVKSRVAAAMRKLRDAFARDMGAAR